MALDQAIITSIVKSGNGTLEELQRAGIDSDYFLDEYRPHWDWLVDQRRKHGRTPGRKVYRMQFPEARLVKVDEADLPHMIELVRKRRKWRKFVELMETSIGIASDMDRVDEAVDKIEAGLKRIYMEGGTHVVDVFSETFREYIEEDVNSRRDPDKLGLAIPTGLTRLNDATGGGFRPKQLITVIGRTGKGKSWLSCLFVKSAVYAGHPCILYSLEMGIEEVMYRLYAMFAASDIVSLRNKITNTGLVTGTVNRVALRKLLKGINEQYAGHLWVTDMSKTRSAYNVDRIAIDIETYKPKIVWVDYVTLLKKKGGGASTDWQIIQEMTSSLKAIAMQHNIVVGMNAQVNRSAIKNQANIFLPRPEHIAFGDAIAADSDLIVSMNREDEVLYYALVKNRSGREFGKTPVQFNVDEGVLLEVDLDEEDEYDED